MFKCFYIFLLYSVTLIKADSEILRCLICKASLDELDIVVKQLDPTIKTDVGGYRLDGKGNMQRQTVSQAKSELVLSGLIDDICTKIDDYVRVVWKNNGTLTIMKMIVDGQMNRNFGEVEFVQDEDLNRSLKYYCEGILEEFEEEIIACYANDVDDIKTTVCSHKAKLCKDGITESDEDDKDEL